MDPYLNAFTAVLSSGSSKIFLALKGTAVWIKIIIIISLAAMHIHYNKSTSCITIKNN